jgi:hypothetical protein
MYINRVKLEKKMKMKQIKPKTNRKITRSIRTALQSQWLMLVKSNLIRIANN